MAETQVGTIKRLVPMAHAVDIERSVEFYSRLGFATRGSLRAPEGRLQWVYLASERAELMLARASGPVPAGEQAVLFYLYSANLVALRDHLSAAGVSVSEITYPSYMPKGEIRIEDPDGYVLLIGQSD